MRHHLVMVIAPAPLRERLGAAVLTAVIVAALGYALLLGLAFRGGGSVVAESLETFTVAPEPPPPERIVPPPKKVNRPSGKASPPNLRSKATEVTAPVPIVQIPPPPMPAIVAPLPDAGVQATSGASDRAGPGTGAGGIGNGHGAGGDGDGDGSGMERVPRLVSGRIKGSDIPESILDTGFRGVVGVRYRVETNGRVTGCTVARSSGNALMDQVTCAAIEKRFRYDPWRDAAGRPVRSTVLRDQQWDIDPPTIDR
ncbi:energy transducer TonB [Sphingomonas melonis]|uniref:Protein TonB n=1 Tax=Sphingomonas melonis TaxID=152682 RepID=A0A7Y9FMA9_9SPHN|nr:energy transducer TonB [Sphingomonas melonis]NYD89849.1 protein TonB [Sphingomonas melonis]